MFRQYKTAGLLVLIRAYGKEEEKKLCPSTSIHITMQHRNSSILIAHGMDEVEAHISSMQMSHRRHGAIVVGVKIA